MSKDTNIVFFVFLLGLFAVPVWGQQDSIADKSWGGVPDKIGTDEYRGRSLPYLREKAESSYQEQDFGRAAKFYSMILDARPEDTAALVGFANAAYRNTKYDTAAWACRLLIDSNLVDNKDGRIPLLLADIYYCLGKFGSARLWYDYIGALPHAAASTKFLAQTGLKKCAAAEAALEKMQMPGAKNIHIEPLPRRVRTRYSEYAPVWKGDSVLYYTAYGGFPYREDERVPVRRPMKMVIAEPATDTIAVRDAGINEENRHTAYTAFNTRDDAMYYAVGKNAGDHQIRFELYRRKRTGSGGWGLPERLPEKINLKKHTATQPHVAMLPGEETETLFFVSDDRPGGKGGRDIWFCKIQNDTFTEPQNLSSLNTPGDDVSPFYYAADKILYFSSNGYPTVGMGGFDILQVAHTGEGWDTLVTALPPPLNSGANDLFYTRPDCSDMAFLSSNRNGAMNFSDEDCCYDLFRVEMTKPEFLAVTFHEITKDSLANTTMRLYDLTANRLVEDAVVLGAYRGFDLQPGIKYMLIASKPGYIPDTVFYDMPKSVWKCGKTEHLYLRPIKINLVASVYDCQSGQPIEGALFKFYTDAQAPPGGKVTTGANGGPLDSTIVNNANSHERQYELQFAHRYRLAVSKEGYTSMAGEPDTSAAVTTEFIEHDTTLELRFCLNQGFPLEISVKSECGEEWLTDVNIELTDLTRNITTNYFSGQDSIFKINIQYDSRYQVVVSKKDYTSIPDKSERIFRTDDKPRPRRMVINTLRLMPPLPECLPIVLYFHNDEPGPHTRKDTITSEPYDTSYVRYYNRRAEYLKRCDPDSVQLMADFFDNEVKREWDKLFNISTYLYDYLDAFNDSMVQVAITLKGYASPLGNKPYNLSLSKRRVKSVENYFMGIEGSILQLFMADSTLKRNLTPRKKGRDRLTSEARLDIRLEKFGAAKELEPKFQRGPLAIYSVSAARQRRVEIVGIEMIPNKIGSVNRKSSQLPNPLHRKDPKP